jgi:predicted DNA binding CopG/RHH family protein
MKKSKKTKKTKKLTRLELLELENAHLQQSIYDLELEKIDMQKELAKKEKRLLGYQVRDLDSIHPLLSDSMQTIKEKRTGEKAKYVKIIDRIQKRLGLKTRFGYDPESGEINMENNE